MDSFSYLVNPFIPIISHLENPIEKGKAFMDHKMKHCFNLLKSVVLPRKKRKRQIGYRALKFLI